jgi:hypothetical protein
MLLLMVDYDALLYVDGELDLYDSEERERESTKLLLLSSSSSLLLSSSVVSAFYYKESYGEEWNGMRSDVMTHDSALSPPTHSLTRTPIFTSQYFDPVH